MARRDAVRITTAPTRRSDEIAARQRRYVISMSIRTLCFVAAVAVGPGVLRWVLIAGAVFLPYVAVVMANAGETREDAFDLPHQVVHPELEGPQDQTRHTQG